MASWKKAAAVLVVLALVLCLTPVICTDAQGATGWVEYEGNRYYLEDGQRYTGWRYVDGKPYYFNERGVLSSLWGVDVSEWNADIDWEKVKADGCGFALIRCGYRGYQYGTLAEDEKFDANIRGAQAAGIPVGVYFYSEALNTAEAVEEAEYIAELLSRYPRIDYPVCMDMEDYGDVGGRVSLANPSTREMTDIALAFCNRMEELGYDAVLYSFTSLLNYNVYSSEVTAAGHDIWFAYYNYYPGGYYGSYTMWQYSAEGQVDGIDTDVDMDVTILDYTGQAGIGGQGTLELLEGETTEVTPIEDYPQIARGNSSHYVYLLQVMLNDLGYSISDNDGTFAGDTEAQVIAFQAAAGLPATGVVDTATWKALAAQHGEGGDEPVPPGPTDLEHQWRVTAESGLNLRSEDGTDSDILLTIPSQALVTLLETNADQTWGRVVYNNSTGWVSMEYLQKVYAEPPVDPPVDPPTPDDPSESFRKVLELIRDGEFEAIREERSENTEGTFEKTPAAIAKGFEKIRVCKDPQEWPDLPSSEPEQPQEPEESQESENPQPPEQPEDPGEAVDYSAFPELFFGTEEPEYLMLLQMRLNALGFSCGTADGVYGNNTFYAVEAFQASRGLPVDGIVNSAVWTALFA